MYHTIALLTMILLSCTAPIEPEQEPEPPKPLEVNFWVSKGFFPKHITDQFDPVSETIAGLLFGHTETSTSLGYPQEFEFDSISIGLEPRDIDGPDGTLAYIGMPGDPDDEWWMTFTGWDGREHKGELWNRARIYIDESDMFKSYEHIYKNFWYWILLHETIHILGMGSTTRWNKIAVEGNGYVCGVRVDWRSGHWVDTDENFLMEEHGESGSESIIGEHTLCALERIGWRIRK